MEKIVCDYKDGDILVVDDKYLFIYNGKIEEPDFLGSYLGVNDYGRLEIGSSKYWARIDRVRRATEDEKHAFAEVLLQASKVAVMFANEI